MKKSSALYSLAIVFFAMMTSACSDSDSDDDTDSPDNGNGEDTHWVATWATGLQITEPRNLPMGGDDMAPYPEDPGFAGNTLRQAVRVSIGGSKLRLTLSNEYGVAPVEFESVHVAKFLGNGAIDPSTDTELKFDGAGSVTIPAKETATSDEFDFALEALSDLAITVKLGAQSKEATGHPGSRTTSYLQEGDAVTAAELPDAHRTAHWYFISGVDVLAPEKSAAIVVLGDSLTDGRGTTTDGNDRWTDFLAKRLQDDPSKKHIAVINQGIGGNSVYLGGIGPSGKSRFDRDVLATPGIKWVIVLEGVNDIGNSTEDISAELIAAYEEMIEKADAKDVEAFGSPILPFKGNTGYGTEPRLAIRTAVNEWIRTSDKFDAVIDLDAAVRDPADTEKLLDAYATLPSNVGTDYLHLNPDGYKAMADAVDLDLFD